eukprot:g44755.t1
MGSVSKETVEQYLENNPQFTKEYFNRKLRPETIGAIFNGTKVGLEDGVSFKDLCKLEESDIVFELVKELQDDSNVEKQMHKVLQRIVALVCADRGSLFIFRSRNGIAELATRLFNVTRDSSFENNLVLPQGEIVFPLDIGVVGWTAKTKKIQNVPDVTK